MNLVKELLYEEYMLKIQYFATDERRAEDVITYDKIQAIRELLKYYKDETKERYQNEKKS